MEQTDSAKIQRFVDENKRLINEFEYESHDWQGSSSIFTGEENITQLYFEKYSIALTEEDFEPKYKLKDSVEEYILSIGIPNRISQVYLEQIGHLEMNTSISEFLIRLSCRVHDLLYNIENYLDSHDFTILEIKTSSNMFLKRITDLI
jgi:hypothetical protein